MVTKERADDNVLIGLVAALEHGVEAAGARRAARRWQRREGEGRRALEVARHQEAAGRQGRQRMLVGAAGAQIGGEGAGEGLGLGIGSGLAGVDRRQSVEESGGLARRRQRGGRGRCACADHSAKLSESSGRSSSHSPG